MTEPKDHYVDEGGDGTDPELPEDAPLPLADHSEDDEQEEEEPQ